jgi:hypothetical protein
MLEFAIRASQARDCIPLVLHKVLLFITVHWTKLCTFFFYLFVSCTAIFIKNSLEKGLVVLMSSYKVPALLYVVSLIKRKELLRKNASTIDNSDGHSTLKLY